MAFDVHSVSSVYLGQDDQGHDHWETQRTEMGELLYRLKYKKDLATVDLIVTLLDGVKGIEKFDLIAPIPPTDRNRPFQPVAELAKALGARRGVRVEAELLKKAPGGGQLKNIEDPAERTRCFGRHCHSVRPRL